VTPVATDNDLVSFSKAMNGDNSDKLLDAMNNEFKLMTHHCVWDLMKLSKGCKRVGSKRIFKTKCDSHSNVERYKARLVAKGFTQKDDINYKILSKSSWH